jgi:hypothetical protein
LRGGAQAIRAACEPAKLALDRGLQALPLAGRGLKTTVERWRRR